LLQEGRMETKPPASPPEPAHRQGLDSRAGDHSRDDHPHDDHPHKSRWQRFLVWGIILLIFAVVFFVVLRHHDDSAAPTSRRALGGTVTITTATANKGNIGVYLQAIGTVTSVYTDSITAQVTGLINQVHYQEGQLVRKGQPLIDIDPRPYQAQLMQAEGALERDIHVLEQAQMDLERYRDAWARNGIPKQTLDDQEKIVLQDQGTVKNDQGTVQYDKVQVAFCHITAPIPGRVGLRLVDPGNVVQANSTTPLVVIAQIQPITVIFTIAEDNLPQVQEQMRQGKNKRLAVDAFDRAQQTKIASGKLQTIDNQIDTTTGTVKLRATFENKNGALFPNQFVNARLLVKTLEGVTLIPTSAIQHNGQTAFVYLIQNDTALIRNVTPGVSDGGMTAVSGINPGDVVANSSFEKLQDKAKIVVSKKPIPAATSEGPAQ
jgi:membrane fusion protein, multidrug efflux system